MNVLDCLFYLAGWLVSCLEDGSTLDQKIVFGDQYLVLSRDSV